MSADSEMQRHVSGFQNKCELLKNEGICWVTCMQNLGVQFTADLCHCSLSHCDRFLCLVSQVTRGMFGANRKKFMEGGVESDYADDSSLYYTQQSMFPPHRADKDVSYLSSSTSGLYRVENDSRSQNRHSF